MFFCVFDARNSNVAAPRPKEGEEVPGLGFIFVEFVDVASATKAKKALAGRRFAANVVEATFFPLELYKAGVSRQVKEEKESRSHLSTQAELIAGAYSSKIFSCGRNLIPAV